jgi:16S rRNA (guanine527-N7)-methyltransferase
LTENSIALLNSHEKELRRYVALLASYEGKIRLTGPTDPEILWKEHIMDCLASLPYLPESGEVLDAGSGGGLPGLVWAICRPDLQVTLIDSVRKKCGALEEMKNALQLNNISVVCARCEVYAKERREEYSLAAARALAATDLLLEYLAPFVMHSGCILAFKGPQYKDEISPLSGKWSALGLGAPEIFAYSTNEKERFFLLWRKEAPTPSRFPRKIGIAEKNKWWR